MSSTHSTLSHSSPSMQATSCHRNPSMRLLSCAAAAMLGGCGRLLLLLLLRLCLLGLSLLLCDLWVEAVKALFS